MQRLFELHFSLLLMGSFIFSFVCYFVFANSKKLPHGILRKLFFVPSSTGAMLLGGLSLAIAVICSNIALIFVRELRAAWSPTDCKLLLYGSLVSIVVIIEGYIDDKYELKPMVKLLLQLISVTLFALLSANTVYPANSAPAFFGIAFFGLCVLNGCNLLDGIDTLMIKLAIPTYLGSAGLGLFMGHSGIVAFSLVCTVPLLAFYFFNKSPAKLYLGEIGGNFIGFTFLILSCLLFKNSVASTASFSALGLALPLLVLPVVEVAMSFLRRVYNKKSPFQGDYLHVHHILKLHKHMSDSKISSVMGIVFSGIMLCEILMAAIFGPFNAAMAMFTVISSIQIIVGARYWFETDIFLFEYFFSRSKKRESRSFIVHVREKNKKNVRKHEKKKAA